MKLMKWLGIFILLSSLANAQEGKLPRKGKKKDSPIDSLKSKYTTSSSQKTKPSSGSNVNISSSATQCSQVVASDLQGRVVQDDKNIYYLARVKALKAKGGQNYFYSLFSMEKSKSGAKISKLFSLEGPIHMGLIFHSDSGNGFSTVAFRGPENGCGSGVGEVTNIPYFSNRSKQPKPTSALKSGPYSLVRSENGRFLAVFAKHQVISMDPASNQKRAVGAFSKDESPISYDPESRLLYVWQAKGATLAVYPALSKVSNHSYKVAAGEVLLVDGPKFTVASRENSNRSFLLEELDHSLQKIPTKKSYQITLPTGVSDRNLSFVINRDSKEVVIYNSSVNTSGEGRLLVYDYGNGVLKSDLQVKADKYVDQVVFNKASKTVKKDSLLVFLNNRSDKSLNKILVYRDKWNSIPF